MVRQYCARLHVSCAWVVDIDGKLTFVTLRRLVHRRRDDYHGRTSVWSRGRRVGQAGLERRYNAVRELDSALSDYVLAHYAMIRSCVGGACAIKSEPLSMNGSTRA